MITQDEANYTNSSGFLPRPALDTSLRRLIYGRIRPMGRPGLLERLFHHGQSACRTYLLTVNRSPAKKHTAPRSVLPRHACDVSFTGLEC